MANRIRTGTGLIVGMTLVWGCASVRQASGPRVPACPGPLVATEAIKDDFTARHSARIISGEVELALRLVTEKRGGRLVVMGFSALGAKRFAVTQQETAVQTERFGPPLAVPPENILRDLHRIYFPQAVEGLHSDPGVVAVSGRSKYDQPMTRIENSRCGYEAIYVTLSKEVLP